MRIGGSSIASTHAAGMSALWHDAALDEDGLPLKRLHIPTVEKKIEDLPLPGEDHQLPEGYADPFARMDAAYDVAAAQMERGLKGTEFLHGRNSEKKAPPRVEGPAATGEITLPQQAKPQGSLAARSDERRPIEHHAETKTYAVEAGDRSRPMDHRVKEDARVERETVRQISQAAGHTGPAQPNAAATAARKEAERATEALHMAESLGIPAALTPMAATQIAQAATLPAAVASAVTIAGAAVSAASVVTVGIAQGMSEEPALLRRGLRRATQEQQDQLRAPHVDADD